MGLGDDVLVRNFLQERILIHFLISAAYSMVGGSARLRTELITFNLCLFLLIYKKIKIKKH